MFYTESLVGITTLPRDVIENIEDDVENAFNKINITDGTDNAATEPIASCSGQHQNITEAKQKEAESSSKTSGKSNEYDIGICDCRDSYNATK